MTFLFKNLLFFCLFYWLIEETNAAKHYERTKFDKNFPCFNLNLRYYGQLFVLVFKGFQEFWNWKPITFFAISFKGSVVCTYQAIINYLLNLWHFFLKKNISQVLITFFLWHFLHYWMHLFFRLICRKNNENSGYL